MANGSDEIKTYGAIRCKTAEGKAAFAQQIYDEEQEQFQSEINQRVEKSATVQVSDSNATLDISDAEGNVIGRFAGGDFKTKNFNSANIKVEKVNGKNVLYLGK